MAESVDSGLDSGGQEVIKELYAPLTKAVKETVVSLVKRNRGRGEEKNISLWAAQQVKKIAEHAANHTAVQLIKADEERKRKERESLEQEKAQAMQFIAELLKKGMNMSSGGTSLSDHGTGVIQYPWKKKKIVGKGGFGVVYMATDKNDFNFAVKEVARRGQEGACLRDEISCLSKLSHKNIVNYYGYAEGNGKIFMYLELMSGSVRDVMEKQKKPLSLEKAQKYTRDIVEGLVYLHSENLIHRDIKCANILLDESDTGKLADMGLSKSHEQETMLQYDDAAGTLLWMSPEVLSNQTAGKRSDVWSLACTVYEMLKLFPPFADYGMIGALLGIQTGKLVHRDLVDEDESIVGSVKSFLMHIFVSFDKRPYAGDIAQHKWLLDW